MFENDFIMRTIHDMVRMLLKLLFGIDPKAEDYELEEDAEDAYRNLKGLVREGRINDAENYLYDLIEDMQMEYLKVGILFYDGLNELDNKTLERMDYSREEISDGLKNLLEQYGYSGLADTLK